MSTSLTAIPAARYLRMSTDMQQYSLDNQAAGIAEYARAHNFEIVATYTDASRSGVVLRHRTGLQKLLHDVLTGPPYKAVLVYDVSRWGRFQDTDESAHYEFICREAGIPVYYCAEEFFAEDCLANSVLKTVKRAMAAEYSRELSEKVIRGQTRLAQAGFAMGGKPNYGLKRVMVDSEGHRKQVLCDGQRKSLSSDRVIYVPGSPKEVKIVRWIFELAAREQFDPSQIARRLNAAGKSTRAGFPWRADAVAHILENPRYAGFSCWRRTTLPLKTSRVALPPDQWVLSQGKIQAIVSPEQFRQAQFVRATRRWDKQSVADRLRWLAKNKKVLSMRTLATLNGRPSYRVITEYYGCLERAAQELGLPFSRSRGIKYYVRNRRTHRMLLKKVCRMFPKRIALITRGTGWKPQLLVDGEIAVSVLLPRWLSGTRRAGRWLISPTEFERQGVCLCCFMDREFKRSKGMYLIDRFPSEQNSFTFPLPSKHLNLVRLKRLDKFCDAVRALAANCRIAASATNNLETCNAQ